MNLILTHSISIVRLNFLKLSPQIYGIIIYLNAANRQEACFFHQN